VKWAREVLGLEPGAYGLLAATWGIGTLGASYGLAFMGEIRQKGRIFLYGSIASGFPSPCSASPAHSRWQASPT
jgi:hypothetical protein